MLNKYCRRSKDTASRVIDNEAIIVIPQESITRVLNEVGSRIWQLLDGKNTVEDVINTVSSEFEVSCREAKGDILDFIKELKEKKMVLLSDEQI